MLSEEIQHCSSIIVHTSIEYRTYRYPSSLAFVPTMVAAMTRHPSWVQNSIVDVEEYSNLNLFNKKKVCKDVFPADFT